MRMFRSLLIIVALWGTADFNPLFTCQLYGKQELPAASRRGASWTTACHACAPSWRTCCPPTLLSLPVISALRDGHAVDLDIERTGPLRDAEEDSGRRVLG